VGAGVEGALSLPKVPPRLAPLLALALVGRPLLLLASPVVAVLVLLPSLILLKSSASLEAATPSPTLEGAPRPPLIAEVGGLVGIGAGGEGERLGVELLVLVEAVDELVVLDELVLLVLKLVLEALGVLAPGLHHRPLVPLQDRVGPLHLHFLVGQALIGGGGIKVGLLEGLGHLFW